MRQAAPIRREGCTHNTLNKEVMRVQYGTILFNNNRPSSKEHTATFFVC